MSNQHETTKPLLVLVLIGLLSSTLLALAIPNELFVWGNPLFGMIALIPLYSALRFAGSYKRAFVIGMVFGGAAHGFSSFWLWFFKGFRLWTLGTTTLAYIVVYGFLGWYLFGALKRGGTLRPFLFALIWAVFEYAKSFGFLGYPWGLLPYAWNTILPFNQAVELFGLYSLSFVLALLNACTAELLVPLCMNEQQEVFDRVIMLFTRPSSLVPHDRPKLLLPSMLLSPFNKYVERLGWTAMALLYIGLFFAYGFIRMQVLPDPMHQVSMVLVQHNTDNWLENDGGQKTLTTCVTLAQAALEKNPEADLLVFSETSLVRPWKESVNYYKRNPPVYPLVSLLQTYNVYLFSGAPVVLDWETFKATNSVLLISPDGAIIDDYAKIHPVPFAESIPFWDVEPFRKFMQEVVGLSSGWEMGTRYTIFTLPLRSGTAVRFAAPICFEDAFSDLNRIFVKKGIDFLLNLTNDSWSQRVSAEIQHFVAARYRCIEYRVPLVRSTNGGLSAVVDIDGNVLKQFPVFTAMADSVSVPIYKRTLTPYAVLGDWIVAVFAILLALSIVVVRRYT